MTATTPFGQSISAFRFRQIEGTIAAAARGESWAEVALGELTDQEFDAFLRQRRELRLTDPVKTKAGPTADPLPLPTFPIGVGSGSPSSYNSDPIADGRQLRGLSRIEAALAASAAG